MVNFDMKEVLLMINGREISDFADGADVIKVANNAPNGEMVIGANGTGVFVANPDQSGTVTLKLKQHSSDNKFLNELHTQQKMNLKGFTPLMLTIKDLINNDVVVGSKGYFTKQKEIARGVGHNPMSWEIVFEKLSIDLKDGEVK